MDDDETAHEKGVRTSAKPAARRKAGTGFPVVSLAEASEILKTAGKYGFEHSVAAFAKHMGHSTTNSGAFRQRLAAFRDWRLVAGRGDTVSMTEIARIIALPPDADAERAALEAAFRNCGVFLRLYDGSQKNVPLERQGLGNRAVHDFGVAPSSIAKFVASFVDSAVIAGLAQVMDDGGVTLLDSVQTEEMEPHAPPTVTAPTTTQPRGGQGPRAGAPVVHQSWPIDGGTVVFEIRSDKPLPATAYAMVGEVVATLERLAGTLAPSIGEVQIPTEGSE